MTTALHDDAPESRQPVDLLVRARWVVAGAEPTDSAIEDGAVAVKEGTIVAVGTFDELDASCAAREVIGSPERHTLLPGLINSHHHGWGLGPFQLGARDDHLEPWLIELMSLRPVDPYLDALMAATRLLRAGITCVQHAGLLRDPGALASETRATLRGYVDAGIRVVYGVPIQDRQTFVYRDDEAFLATLPPATADAVRRAGEAIGGPSVEDFETLVAELCAECREVDRVSIVLSPQGIEWCSDGLLRSVRQLATEHRVGIHMHFLESQHQREHLLAEKGMAPLSWLAAQEFLGPDVSLAHAVWMSDDEIELCARSGVSVCHNPGSNLRLRVGTMPLRAMLEAGVNVALGLDSTTLADDDDPFQELRLARALHGAPRGLVPQPALRPREMLQLMTSAGARAVGLPAQIGRLAPGRQADLICVDHTRARSPFTDPTLDPLEVIWQRARADDVDLVLVGGEVVVRGGCMIGVDEDELARDLARSAAAPLEPAQEAWIAAARATRPYVDAYYRGRSLKP